MGKATPASIGIDFKLNAAYLDTQAKQAKKSLYGVRDTVTSLSSAFSTLGTAFFATEIISSIGSVASSIKDSLISAVHSGIESIDALNDAASHIGITTDALASLNLIAELNGSSSETLQKSLTKMQVVLGGISSESDPAAKALADMGISLDSIAGKSAEERLVMIAKGIQGIGDHGQKAAAGVQFLGKTGTELNEVLDVLANGGLEEAKKRAFDLGLAISQIDANQVANAKDAMDELGKAAQGVGNQLAIAFSPLIAKGATDLLGISLDTAGSFGLLHVKILSALDGVLTYTEVLGNVANVFTGGALGMAEWVTGIGNISQGIRGYTKTAIEESQKRAKAAAEEKKAREESVAVEAELTAEVKKSLPDYQSFITSLEQKSQAWGKNATEADIYKHNLDQINPALAEYARNLQKEIDLKEANKKATEEMAKATIKAAEEERKAKIDFDKAQSDKIKELLDSIKNPQQKLQDEIMKLQEALFLNPGKINQGQYAKLLQNAFNSAGVQSTSGLLPGVKLKGSVEAENAVLENTYSNRDSIQKEIAKTAKDHFEEAQRQSTKLDSMVDGLSNLAILNIS